MQELRLMVIDARQMNMICSIETYVNERLADLYADSKVSNIKLENAFPDYFVFSFIYKVEDSIRDDDYKPP